LGKKFVQEISNILHFCQSNSKLFNFADLSLKPFNGLPIEFIQSILSENR